jgi:hypothetical protein
MYVVLILLIRRGYTVYYIRALPLRGRGERRNWTHERKSENLIIERAFHKITNLFWYMANEIQYEYLYDTSAHGAATTLRWLSLGLYLMSWLSLLGGVMWDGGRWSSSCVGGASGLGLLVRVFR